MAATFHNFFEQRKRIQSYRVQYKDASSILIDIASQYTGLAEVIAILYGLIEKPISCNRSSDDVLLSLVAKSRNTWDYFDAFPRTTVIRKILTEYKCKNSEFEIPMNVVEETDSDFITHMNAYTMATQEAARAPSEDFIVVMFREMKWVAHKEERQLSEFKIFKEPNILKETLEEKSVADYIIFLDNYATLKGNAAQFSSLLLQNLINGFEFLQFIEGKINGISVDITQGGTRKPLVIESPAGLSTRELLCKQRPMFQFMSKVVEYFKANKKYKADVLSEQYSNRILQALSRPPMEGAPKFVSLLSVIKIMMPLMEEDMLAVLERHFTTFEVIKESVDAVDVKDGILLTLKRQLQVAITESSEILEKLSKQYSNLLEFCDKAEKVCEQNPAIAYAP